MHYEYGSGIFMWILFLVIGGLLVYFVVLTMRTKGQSQGETALDILKKRYAKGELTKEEFEKIKRELLE